MSLAIIGVVGTAAVAGGGAYYANQQQKKATQAAMGQAPQALGRVPEAAQYQPVDFDQEQLSAILANIGAMPGIEDLMRMNNGAITADSLRRAKKLIPGYKQSMRTYGEAGQNLLNGRLPFSDVMSIVGDRNELANSMGTPGAAGPATLKDLGLSQLDAIKAGGGILKDMVGMAETISPIGRHMTPQGMQINPMQRIGLQMDQNQLIQQSQQSANNLAASGDPAAYAQMQMALAQGGQDAATTRSYADAASGLLSSMGGAYQSYRRPAPGYASNSVQTGTYQGLPVMRPTYYNGRLR